MQRIFDELKEKNGFGIDGQNHESQTAHFTTVMALVYPDGREVTFEGCLLYTSDAADE